MAKANIMIEFSFALTPARSSMQDGHAAKADLCVLSAHPIKVDIGQMEALITWSRCENSIAFSLPFSYRRPLRRRR